MFIIDFKKILYFLLTIIAFFLALSSLNAIKCVKIVIYHVRFKHNCATNNYLKNIKFYRAVTHLFRNADVNRIDLRNGDIISKFLEEPCYEKEINVMFLKAKQTFIERMKKPWYILLPSAYHTSKFANGIVSVAKWILLFLLNQVSASVFEASGIGDTLWEILVLKFPYINNLINNFYPF